MATAEQKALIVQSHKAVAEDNRKTEGRRLLNGIEDETISEDLLTERERKMVAQARTKNEGNDFRTSEKRRLTAAIKAGTLTRGRTYRSGGQMGRCLQQDEREASCRSQGEAACGKGGQRERERCSCGRR